MVASKVSVGAMKVNSSMETVRENVAEWMFLTWNKLRVYKELIASGWTRYGILKAWDFQIQNEAMRVNFEKSLFGELGDLVEDQNSELDVLDYYLDMDVLDFLARCVSNLSISDEIDLPDLNESFDLENDILDFAHFDSTGIENCPTSKN
jgi:hypothetical protein